MQESNWQRRDFMKFTFATMAGLTLPNANTLRGKSTSRFRDADRRPNIILMMADDLGFSDLGCYGSEVDTPNLDSFAKDGIRFTQFYNCARCCPTRASLLTGLYPHQAGIGHMVKDLGYPSYRGELSPNSISIAQVLKARGYSTAMVGKWHLTSDLGVNERKPATKKNWPLQRGFDKFYGTLTGAGSYYAPVTLVNDNIHINETFPVDYYYTDALSNKVVDCIKEYAEKDNPFFIYVAYTAPHWPLHAFPNDIVKYRDRYSVGWDKIRQDRYNRMVAMEIIDKKWPLSPRDPESSPWEDVNHKEWEACRMAVHAAMIDKMDQGIGRIKSTLQQLEIEDNTLVLFLSDNGGAAEWIAPRPHDIIYVPKETPDGRPVQVGNNPSIMPGPADTYQTYGLPWANVSNTPFRLHKRWVHEGGISTPLIVFWPKGITKPGRLIHKPGHIIDIMATCIDVANAPYPNSYQENAIIPFEGKSLLPVFQDKVYNEHSVLFWEHEGNRALRQGKWKLVSYFNIDHRDRGVGYGERKGEWELYDIEADRSELVNLAEKYPEKVIELVQLFKDWSDRCGVRPWEEVRPSRDS